MNPTQLLEKRTLARATKRQAEADLLEFHRRAVAAMVEPTLGQQVRANALASIAVWERGHLCHAHYIAAWRSILALPSEALSAAILRPDDEGVALRQNSPFGFLAISSAA